MSGVTYSERELAALGSRPGICREISPDGRSMCDLDIDHDGDHDGFELPTVEVES